jgi:hypothetical protein
MPLGARVVDLWRMLRHGPALYRASRRVGGSRLASLAVVIWP